jgi:teichuronic acid biosynthesis glycosyltransferase TuaH
VTAGERQLVWLAGVPWDGIQGTDRHLVTALREHARILWVDPPVSMARRPARHHLTGQSMRPLLTRLDERVVRLTPAGPPGLTRPGVRDLTDRLVRHQVRGALRQLSMTPHAVVSTHLENLLGHWGPRVVNALYGTDDYVAGAELMGLSAQDQARQERRTLSRADVVMAVSPQLAERWASLGAEPVVIPNGCWPTTGVPQPAPEAHGLPRPVAGLIGQLSDRIDLAVLEAVAAAGISLLIVGPQDPRWGGQRFADLVAQPHVRYVGPVPASRVPEFLAAIDIGLTPYRDTQFNRASFPLKTLEYLGAGVPVASTDLPTAQWLRADADRRFGREAASQIMILARLPADFVEAVRAITGAIPLDSRDLDVRQRCASFAAGHSWPRRAEALAAAIGLI